MTPTTEIKTTGPRRTLLDISHEIIALHDARQDAEDDGDAEAIAAIDRQLELHLRTELQHKVDRVRNFIREQEAAAEFYKEEAANLLHKAKRARDAAARVKGFVLGIMQALGIPKYQGAIHWIRKQANGGIKPLDIVQPDLVPDAYKRITVQMSMQLWRELGDARKGVPIGECLKGPEPDPYVIREALERGVGVPGCRLLERGEHIQTS